MKIKNLILILFLTANLLAQESDYLNRPSLFDLSINLNYNTGAKVFLTPRSADPDLRNQYYTFDGFLSYTFEIKTNVWNSIIYFGIGTEILRTSSLLYSVRGLFNNLPRTFQVEESFQIYPLELMIYYIFPFSRHWYWTYMGSGIGVYYGSYSRKIYDLMSKSKVIRMDYGILVNAGVDISLIKNLSLKFEMKFRDPELEFRNEFTKTETFINGDRIQLFEKIFYTKINLDGLNLILGLNYRF